MDASERTLTNIRKSQVYAQTAFGAALEVRYQILAVWDEYAWVLVYGAKTRTGPMIARDRQGRPIRNEPKTLPLDFFYQDGLVLLYDLRACQD